VLSVECHAASTESGDTSDILKASERAIKGLEADHSLPTGAEVKKIWIHTPTAPYIFRE
jgi:hypothetical protein